MPAMPVGGNAEVVVVPGAVVTVAPAATAADEARSGAPPNTQFPSFGKKQKKISN